MIFLLDSPCSIPKFIRFWINLALPFIFFLSFGGPFSLVGLW